MASKRLSLTARAVSVLAQTDPAVGQIPAAALLLREVIGVGCFQSEMSSLRCNLLF